MQPVANTAAKATQQGTIVFIESTPGQLLMAEIIVKPATQVNTTRQSGRLPNDPRVEIPLRGREHSLGWPVADVAPGQMTQAQTIAPSLPARDPFDRHNGHRVSGLLSWLSATATMR
jgi:hypothetical protein